MDFATTTIAREFAVSAAEVMAACELVEAACAARGLDADATYRAKLALEELASNLVRHALAPGATFRLQALVSAERAAIELVDSGPAFDPTVPSGTSSAPPESIGGLGLQLVRSVVDELRYQRAGAENRTSFAVRRRGI
jgi:anti-sigma regulatory factor (Ser/Thr protein kinase)